MGTYTTTPGFFDYVTNNPNQIDYDYDKFIDYDDTQSRWEISSFLMRKENSERVGSPEFYTWEGEYQERIVTVNGVLTTGDTTFVLDSTEGVRADDILHVATADEDGQHVRVTTVVSATDLTVVRIGTADTIADGAELIILTGAASSTAASSAQPSFVYPSRVTNTVQIVRRSFEWSITEDATDLYTQGSSSSEKAAQCRVEFKKDLAHLAWASISTTKDAPATAGVLTSKGIIPQLAANASANRINAGGPLAYDDLTNLADALMEFSDTREYMVFCGTKALTGLAVLGTSSSTYQTKPHDNIYGFKGQAMQVGDMTFMFKFERTFKEMGSVYNAYAVALSMKNIKFAHIGKKFSVMPNIQADPGGETKRTQMRAQCGIKMQHNKRHGYIFGLT